MYKPKTPNKPNQKPKSKVKTKPESLTWSTTRPTSTVGVNNSYLVVGWSERRLSNVVYTPVLRTS